MTTLGSYDAQGIWQMGELDEFDTASEAFRKLSESVSDEIANDRVRLTALETGGTHAEAAGQGTSVAAGVITVTFPAGRFSAAPIVTAVLGTYAANAQLLVDNITTTGCRILIYTIGTGVGIVGVTARWHAVQMTPTTGAG